MFEASMLQRRAEMLARVRAFFAARGVLEVDTPILGDGVVVEAHIDPIPCRVNVGGGGGVSERHLLTSPEGPMKRLLAAGSGPIYQLAHAFRDGEAGRRHAVEFAMLEWYRPGFDDRALMDEVEALVRGVMPSLGGVAFARRSYREVFLEGAGIDPFDTDVEAVYAACGRLGVSVPDGAADGTLDDALDLLLVGHLEPSLGAPVPLFVHDYPASQAALARIEDDANGRRVARRFELYLGGVELANGYHELADAGEQRRRFETANRARQEAGRPALPVDEALLSALQSGFPDCAGVALGFDRLVMVATNSADIDAVRGLPFDLSR